MSTELSLRPATRDEFPAMFRQFFANLGFEAHEETLEREGPIFEPERSLAALDEDRIIGTSAIFSRALSVPGGELPVAAVSLVSVAPTHRRRGILTSIMRRQLTELHEQQREPVAALFASEAGIYGRFGYGLAARSAALTGATRSLQLRPGVDLGGGRIRLESEQVARPHLIELYDAVRPNRPGWLDRNSAWWDLRLYDPERRRDGATSLRFALHEDESGQVDGYAAHRVKGDWGPDGANGTVRILELVASTPQAYASLWSFLLSLDLMRKVHWELAATDEALQLLVSDPRAVRLDVADNLWVRLVDVDRALAARTYATELDVVLEVSDDFCPWNAGRWRLSGNAKGAQLSRTQDAADLTLSSTELGAAYLGGTSLATLAAAGRVHELRPGALAAASTAFFSDRAPWCPEIF